MTFKHFSCHSLPLVVVFSLSIVVPCFGAAEAGDEIPAPYTPRIIKIGIAPDFLTLPPESDQADFEECTIDEEIAEFLYQYDPTIIRRSFPDFDPGDYEEYDHIPPLDRFFRVHFLSNFDVPEVAERLRQLGGVLFAQPSYYNPSGDIEEKMLLLPPASSEVHSPNKAPTPFTPNDPVFHGDLLIPEHQWNLHDDGAGIRCQTAWDITTGDRNVRIGNMDFGFWYEHPDLDIAGGFFVAPGTGGNPYALAPARQLEVYKNAHGTLSGGILAASTNNDTIIAGVAGGNDALPGCSLYDIQLSELDLSLEIMEAWIFALENAVDPLGNYACNVISMSLEAAAYDEEFRGAVRFANAVGANVVTGNGRRTGPRYPSLFDNHWVTAVGAHDSSGAVIYDSGRGGEIDLVAPSNCISTTVPIARDPIFGDMNLAYHSHCSCSVPHVAGSIALLRSFLGNNLRPEDYENIIKYTANDTTTSDGNAQTWADSCGYGRLDIGKALTNAEEHSIVSFSSPNTVITETDYVNISFMSGPYAGPQTAIRYKVAGYISFSNTFSGVPIAWGRCEPAYPYGFHGLSKYSPNYGEPFHGVIENSVDKLGCTAFTYVYKIADEYGQYVYWYPAHYSQIPVTVKAMGPTSDQKGVELTVEKSHLAAAPNPFNSRIDISFQIESPSRVVVDIVDLRGRIVRNLLDQYCEAGKIETAWNGADIKGRGVASGTYFVRVEDGRNVVVEKVSLAK